MGRKARLKRERRGAAKRIRPLPPCSYAKCPNGRPPGTHLIRKLQQAPGHDPTVMEPTGEFLVACDDCMVSMCAVIRAEGIDVQVFSGEALTEAAREQAAKASGHPMASKKREHDRATLDKLAASPDRVLAEVDATEMTGDNAQALLDRLGRNAEALKAALDTDKIIVVDSTADPNPI